jgi:hypothetical protein
MSKSKDIGTAAETAVVRYLIEHGVIADRAALAGANDRGDIHALRGAVVIEVKSRKTAPSAGQIAAWMGELDRAAQRVTSCDVAALVVKRPGAGPANAGQWWVHMRAFDFLTLLRADGVPCEGEQQMAVLTMSLADYTALLRWWWAQ